MDTTLVSDKLAQSTEQLETNILKFVNPTNAEDEKQKFFTAMENKHSYNPHFHYVPRNPLLYYFTISPEYEKMIKDMLAIETDNSALGRLFEKKKKILLKKVRLIKNIGGLDFTRESVSFYGKPDAKLVREASRLVSLRYEQPKRTVSPARALAFLQNEIDKKKLDFKVEFRGNMSATAAVLLHERTLALKDRFYSKEFLKRLKYHEIQTHIYRFANGFSQPVKIFSSELSSDSVATEEGLAAKNEELFGIDDPRFVKNYAGRVLAVNHALKHSFFETFQYLEQFFDKQTAYTLTQRAKRGIVKTERKGAFTKDFLYLKGKQTVDDFTAGGGDLRDLYYGKIALDEVEFVKNVASIKEPKILPNYAAAKK